MSWTSVLFEELLAAKVTLKAFQVCYTLFKQMKSPMVPLKVIGKFDVMVESGKRMALGTFHVIKGCMNTEPLMGFQTSKDLDLVLVANSFQSNGTAISKLVGEYADLFKGIGKMKGVQVDWHVHPAIVPVAQPHRRPKLEVELDKLMADDTIKKVHKPTSWVSPVEITLKQSVNEIRLNVEMKEANKAVPCATQLCLHWMILYTNSMVPPCFCTWT